MKIDVGGRKVLAAMTKPVQVQVLASIGTDECAARTVEYSTKGAVPALCLLV